MMDSDLSTFELALLRTQRDIADTDDEKARLEGEIVRMRSEIARLDQRRVGFVNLSIELKKRLGHEVPEDAQRPGGVTRDVWEHERRGREWLGGGS